MYHISRNQYWRSVDSGSVRERAYRMPNVGKLHAEDDFVRTRLCRIMMHAMGDLTFKYGETKWQL